MLVHDAYESVTFNKFFLVKFDYLGAFGTNILLSVGWKAYQQPCDDHGFLLHSSDRHPIKGNKINKCLENSVCKNYLVS